MASARPINRIQCSRQIVLPFCCCSRQGAHPSGKPVRRSPVTFVYRHGGLLFALPPY
jgi:hypothetical protein